MKPTLIRRILAALLLLCGITAQAANTPVKVGDTFTVTSMGEEVWTFAATTDGVAKIEGAYADEYFGPCLDVYSDAAFSNKVDQFYYGPAHYEFSVVTGHTYYIRNNNWSQDIHARLVMAEAFAFTGATPNAGGNFSVAGDAEAKLHFTTTSVTFTDGQMVCNGHTINIYNFTDFNELVQRGIISYSQEGLSGMADYNGNVLGHTDVDGIVIPFISPTGKGFRNLVYELLEGGQVTEGMTMTLTLHGVRSTITGELLDGTGDLTVTWHVGGMPTQLQMASVPSSLKSWHEKGDPTALATFTFTRELQSAAAILEMGKADENTDDLYSEQLPVTIQGNRAIVDLSGMARNNSIMGLNGSWSSFSLILTNVIDADGNPAFVSGGGQGTTATYTYSLRYVETDVPGGGTGPDDPDPDDPDPVLVRGDQNGDGEVTVADYNKLLRIILAEEVLAPTSSRFIAADLNHDGIINITDVTILINILIRRDK